MTQSNDDQQELSAALARLNARAWGIALGLLGGGGLFLATMVLLIKGGQNVGQHLSLLRAYFPGYSVTIPGSFIGFIYGFVVGYALGRVIGTIYNKLSTPPPRPGSPAR